MEIVKKDTDPDFKLDRTFKVTGFTLDVEKDIVRLDVVCFHTSNEKNMATQAVPQDPFIITKEDAIYTPLLKFLSSKLNHND